MIEDEPTPEELEEARALAEALDGATEGGSAPSRDADANANSNTHATEPPRDALEAAALLRYSQSEGLDPARAEEIGEELARAPEAQDAPSRSGDAVSHDLRRWALIVPAAAIVAAAAAVAVFWRAPEGELPPPHLALLRAQTEVIVAPGEGLAELQEQNTRYRERWLVSMRDRYGGQR